MADYFLAKTNPLRRPDGGVLDAVYVNPEGAAFVAVADTTLQGHPLAVPVLDRAGESFIPVADGWREHVVGVASYGANQAVGVALQLSAGEGWYVKVEHRSGSFQSFPDAGRTLAEVEAELASWMQAAAQAKPTTVTITMRTT